MDMFSDEYVYIARAANDAADDTDDYTDGETFLEEVGRKIVDAIVSLGFTVERSRE